MFKCVVNFSVLPLAWIAIFVYHFFWVLSVRFCEYWFAEAVGCTLAHFEHFLLFLCITFGALMFRITKATTKRENWWKTEKEKNETAHEFNVPIKTDNNNHNNKHKKIYKNPKKEENKKTNVRRMKFLFCFLVLFFFFGLSSTSLPSISSSSSSADCNWRRLRCQRCRYFKSTLFVERQRKRNIEMKRKKKSSRNPFSLFASHKAITWTVFFSSVFSLPSSSLFSRCFTINSTFVAFIVDRIRFAFYVTSQVAREHFFFFFCFVFVVALLFFLLLLSKTIITECARGDNAHIPNKHNRIFDVIFFSTILFSVE